MSWHSYDVPGMWAILTHYDTAPQWRHVGAWRKASELTSAHVRRMRDYREKLADKWPPEHNAAAAVYLDEMDKLIASVQATFETAVENHRTMAAATAALDTAQFLLRPVYTEYVANQRQLGYPQPAPAPGTPTSAVLVRRQAELTAQARTIMDTLSTTLASATYSLVIPPDYTPPMTASQFQQDITAVQTVPRAIPTQAAVRPAGSSHPSVDPVVGMIGPATSPAGPADARGLVLTPAVPALIRGAGVLGAVVATRIRSIAAGRSAVPAPAAEASGARSPVAGSARQPPGTVVAPLGAGNVHAKPGRQPPRRVNPIGGVIAGGQAPARPDIRAFTTPDGHVVRISSGPSAAPALGART
ncbi:MAG TPA: hypothetical protein VFE14_16525, partial [Micromonosporaceae bacterium]|nr:hypothetical protein [Micromonosporaceae bacterium]